SARGFGNRIAPHRERDRQPRTESPDQRRGHELMSLAMNLCFAFSETTKWWDYSGFELWKFVNLFIFVGALVYILVRKAKLGDAFRARREGIKAELEKARAERDAALAKLKEVEERLAGLDSQVTTIKEKSKAEAAEERERIAHSTEA